MNTTNDEHEEKKKKKNDDDDEQRRRRRKKKNDELGNHNYCNRKKTVCSLLVMGRRLKSNLVWGQHYSALVGPHYGLEVIDLHLPNG